MSSQIIEVPVKRTDKAAAAIYYTDPVTGKRGLMGKDLVDQQKPQRNFVEVYDATGNMLFQWQAKSGKPLDQSTFKTAAHIARESFRAHGVN